MIIVLTKEERQQIVKENEQLHKAQEDFSNKITKLQTQDKNRSAVILF